MAMIGIQEMNRTALDDAERARAFAIDAEFMHDVMPAHATFRAHDSSAVIVHADAVTMPGVRLVTRSSF